jgi:pimeloyl-ACP methyl ester carboxylesterase
MTPTKTTFVGACILAFLLSSNRAAQAQTIIPPPESAKPARDYYPVISFLYGTDREFKKDAYGADIAPGLGFGEAQMVLRLHYRRHSDKVCAWFRPRDKSEHRIGLLDAHPIGPADFIRPLRSNDRDETFIYVHGFSTTFAEGAKEAAQIAYDLQLPGIPLLYSWPSHGSVSLGDYKIDQAMVNRPEAIGHLAAFIQKVLENSPHGKIHLVGFSMGTYLLTRALVELAGQGRDLSRIGAIILISADIDAQDFKDLYYPNLKKALGGRLVLYVSGRDQALVLSAAFHHGRPRLGQGGEKATAGEGITTIDATRSSLDCGICHGLSQINGVINDMYLFLHQGLPADKRLLDPYGTGGERVYSLFDDSHDIVTIEDHNFAVAGQIGTYLNSLKLVWLPDASLELALGIDRGYLPHELEFRWNLQSDNFRPYGVAGFNYFDLGGGETAWAAHGGLGAEYAFDSGLGMGLEWDWVSELSRSPSVPSGSTLDELLKNKGFAWSGLHLQLIQYFDFNKLLD